MSPGIAKSQQKFFIDNSMVHDTMASAPVNSPAEAQPTIANDIEKHAAVHDERLSADDKRAVLGDYSGAVAKTDPAEIKLVRKLDWWIMVSFAPLCLRVSGFQGFRISWSLDLWISEPLNL